MSELLSPSYHSKLCLFPNDAGQGDCGPSVAVDDSVVLRHEDNILSRLLVAMSHWLLLVLTIGTLKVHWEHRKGECPVVRDE